MPVGSNVKAFRLARGWSTTELAERASLSQSYVSEIENGKPPGRAALEKLAGAFGVAVSQLLSEDTSLSLGWFWRSRFATLSPGELVQFRSAKVAFRVAWCLKQLVNAFNLAQTAEQLQMGADAIERLVSGHDDVTPWHIDQLHTLAEVPVNFLVNGDPGAIDEKVRTLLLDPNCGAWLMLFERAKDHGIPPEAMDHLLDSVISLAKR